MLGLLRTERGSAYSEHHQLALKAQLSTVKKQNEKIEYRKEKQLLRKTVKGLRFEKLEGRR